MKHSATEQPMASHSPARAKVIVGVALAALVAACSREEAAAPEAKAPAAAAPAAAAKPAAEAEVPKIPMLPGYEYYAGGPSLKRDAYGRFRIASFNGKVDQPPSRGMIFGVKREGDQLEYRVWANGALAALHRGTMREGLFWQDYVENYRGGKLTAREKDTHNDATRTSHIVVEDIDPENGEVIRTRELDHSYLPPAMKPEDMADDPDAPQGGAGK